MYMSRVSRRNSSSEGLPCSPRGSLRSIRHPCSTAMPLPALRSDIVRESARAVTSIVPLPPGTGTQCSSWNPTLTIGSSSLDGISNGRTLASNVSSASRALRLAERTDAKVATASTSVPPAVASEEIVTQSADTPSAYGCCHRGDVEGDDEAGDTPCDCCGEALVAQRTHHCPLAGEQQQRHESKRQRHGQHHL